jgi:hypothetical protein
VPAIASWILGTVVGLLSINGHIVLTLIPSLDALGASFIIFLLLTWLLQLVRDAR